MTERAEQIQARIEAATPGPWAQEDYVDIDADGSYDLAHVTAPDPDEPDTAVRGVALGILREDAGLIANAPADLAWLLAERVKLQAAIDLHNANGERLTGGIRATHWEKYCTECSKTAPCPTIQAIQSDLGKNHDETK